MTTLTAARVITPDGVVGPGAVEIDDGRVVAVTPARGTVEHRVLVPGFVDVQLNGFDDIDVVDAADGDWARLDELLARQGVTAWCPTIVSRPLTEYTDALARIAAAGARSGARPAILGAHLEGPFLGGAPGAHDPAALGPIDRDWLAALPPVVRVVTVAPELPGAPAAIASLAAAGVVVALGHSTATFEEAAEATGAGARLVTHCFNGMAPLHHRTPGLLGAALADDRLTVSLIADLVHVHPAALRIAFRAKPRGGVILVSDAIAWRAREAREQGIERRAGAARLPDGTLAGATAGLDVAVANVVQHAAIDLAGAVFAASTAPALLLGDADRGRIAPGGRADIVELDDDLRWRRTWIAGDLVAG